MRKFWFTCATILAIAFCFSNVCALQTSDAKDKIDISKTINLTLTYHYDDLEFNDISVKIYQIASLKEDFEYELIQDFANYPIVVNGLKTQQEWDMLEETLESYIKKDGLEATIIGKINNNQLKLVNLPVGLYLIETDDIDSEHYTLKYASFLMNLPTLTENGTWNYNIDVYPKGYEYVPKYEKINYVVMKTWQDNGENRPNHVDVEIYKNSQLKEEIVLSPSNNWTYEWEEIDDGSEWNVLEKNVLNGYKVSISKKNNVFIIVNSSINYNEDNPKTKDNINLYLYLFIVAFLSLIIMIICIFKRRRG